VAEALYKLEKMMTLAMGVLVLSTVVVGLGNYLKVVSILYF